jgi:hypothetical protein
MTLVSNRAEANRTGPESRSVVRRYERCFVLTHSSAIRQGNQQHSSAAQAETSRQSFKMILRYLIFSVIVVDAVEYGVDVVRGAVNC